MAMTKTQLVAKLAQIACTDKKTARSVLEALEETVMEEVKGGGAVSIPGLVRISCRQRREGMVRNPATGESVFRPAGRKVSVTIAKDLKATFRNDE